MAAANFSPLAAQVIGIEGGVSNRPLKDDPGGLTDKGVTQAVYDRWRSLRGLPPKSVVGITNKEVVAISRENFWDPIQGDKLPGGVDFAVFDFAFNSGPAQAVKELQRTLGVKADGIVGLATLEALAVADAAEVVNGVCDRRWAFMRKLKNFKANENGWRNRVAHVREESLRMAGGDRPNAPDPALSNQFLGKAPPPPPVPAKKSAKFWASVMAAVGGAVTFLKDLIGQIPDVVRSILPGLSDFAQKSELAKMIVNGLGAVATVAAIYVGFRIVQDKKKEGA